MIVIAAILFLLMPTLSLLYSALGLCRNPHNWRRYLPFLVISIFVLAYAYVPTGTPDLVRYIEMSQRMQNMKLSQAISYMNDGLYVENFYFWIISKTGDYQLLGAIPCTIVYTIAFYITCDTADRYGCQRKIPYYMIGQTMLLPWFSVLCNVRCVFAFSVIGFAAYLEYIKSKKNPFVWILYILPCFIHVTGVVFLLFRLSLFITSKVQWFLSVLVALLPSIIDLLYSRVYSLPIGTVGQTLIKKVYWYFHDDLRSEFSQRISNSLADRFSRYLFVGLAVCFALCILVQLSKCTRANRKYVTFLFLICISTVACYSVITPQYWRFAAALVVCGFGPILMPISNNDKRYRIICVAFVLIRIFCFAGLFIQIWKSRYIVDYIDWAGNFLLNNVFVILFEVVKSICLY